MSLSSYINKSVILLTTDNRLLSGTLLAIDQTTNLVLSNTVERIIRPPTDPEPSYSVAHGLYLVRGEHVAVCGEVDALLDGGVDWGAMRGEGLGSFYRT